MPTTIKDLHNLCKEIERSYGGTYALVEELGIDKEVLEEIVNSYQSRFFKCLGVNPCGCGMCNKLQQTVIVTILASFDTGFRLGRNTKCSKM